jgi:hypothetical protein
VNGRTTHAIAWYLTSRPDAVDSNLSTIALACRAHWSIENCLHWIRDTVHREDASLRHVARLPVIFAACFSIAIAVAKRMGLTHANARTTLRHDPSLVGTMLGVRLEV